jgi:hypothetical protein
MKGGFIEPHDPRWGQVLERTPHDIYHLPRYLELAARHEGGAPVAFYAENSRSAFLLPLLLRKVPTRLAPAGGLLDATSPYGYPGLLATGPAAAEAEAIESFLEVFRGHARERGVVTAFIRLHPFIGPGPELLSRGGEALRHGEVVYIDLTRPAEELWGEVRGSHRTRINRLRRAGFVASFDEHRSYDDFPALYRATMARVAASDFYHFTDAYFRELRAALGERLHLHVVRSPGGEIAAAGLFTTIGGTVQYHLGATDGAYLREAPTKLLFHEVSRWAGERGHLLLNLGGGVGGAADSLFHFKAGFSGSRADFHTFRMILDREAYALLYRRWTEWQGEDSAAPPDFFPTYRYGLPVEEHNSSPVTSPSVA